jgi:hypothetical protein
MFCFPGPQQLYTDLDFTYFAQLEKYCEIKKKKARNKVYYSEPEAWEPS